MGLVTIKATDPLDSYLRNWALFIDTPPVGNWGKQQGLISTQKKSGSTWSQSVPISDGKHKVYFIVSLTDATLGTYSGTAIFDNAVFSFAGVDNDSVAVFDIDVKNGKASRVGGVNSTTTDLVPPGVTGVTNTWQEKAKEAFRKMTHPKEWTKKQKGALMMIGGLAFILIVVAWLVKTKRIRIPGRRGGY